MDPDETPKGPPSRPTCAVMNGQTCIDEEALGFYKDNNHMYQAAVLLDTFNRTVKFRDIYEKREGRKENEGCEWPEWLNNSDDTDGDDSPQFSWGPDQECLPNGKGCQMPPSMIDVSEKGQPDLGDGQDFSADSLDTAGSACEEDSLEMPHNAQFCENQRSPREVRNPVHPRPVSFQSPYGNNFGRAQGPLFNPPCPPMARGHLVGNRPTNRAFGRSPGYQQDLRGKIVRTTRRMESPNSTWLSPTTNDMMINAVSSTPLASPNRPPREVTCYYETRPGRKLDENTTVGICVTRSKPPRQSRSPKTTK